MHDDPDIDNIHTALLILFGVSTYLWIRSVYAFDEIQKLEARVEKIERERTTEKRPLTWR